MIVGKKEINGAVLHALNGRDVTVLEGPQIDAASSSLIHTRALLRSNFKLVEANEKLHLKYPNI